MKNKNKTTLNEISFSSLWKIYFEFIFTHSYDKSYLIISIILSLFGAIFSAINPYLTKNLLDEAILKGNTRLIWILGIVLIVVVLLSHSLGYVQRVIFPKVQRRSLTSIKCSLLKAVLRKYPCIDNQTAGYYMSRIESDPNDLIRIFVDQPIQFVIGFITVMIVLLFVFLLSPFVGIASLLLLVIISLISIYNSKIMLYYSDRAKEQNGENNSTLGNILLGRQLVRLSNTVELECENYREQLGKYYSITVEASRFRAFVDLVIGILYSLPARIILIIGGLLVVENRASVGTIIAAVLYYNKLASLASQLSGMRLDWQSGMASLVRITNILRQPQEIYRKSSSGGKISLCKGIYFDQVSASYDGLSTVLSELTFNIPRGSITCMVGTSGTGKTTLLRLLLRLLEPSSGKIYWDDQPLSSLPITVLRNAIGFVPQDPFLFNRPLEKIVLYRASPCQKNEALQMLQEFRVKQHNGCSYFDMPISEFATNLSAGEKQRIAIIRELLNNPELLVWDEATANIDSEIENEIIQKIFKRLQGKTVLMVTHRLSTVLKSNHLVVLDRGRVVACGSTKHILTNCSKCTDIFRDQWHLNPNDL